MPEHPTQQPPQSVLRTITSGVVKTSAIIGGLYVVRGYMRDRLDDVRVKMEEEQRAREVLRTRFQQTQEDTSYTILALLPTLAAQVLGTMDVDAITRELQNRSRARNTGGSGSARGQQLIAPPTLPPPSHVQESERPPSNLSNADGDGVLVDASVSASETYPPTPYPYSHQPLNPTGSAAAADDSRSDADADAPSSSSSSSEYRTSPAASLSLELELGGQGESEGSGISSSFASMSASMAESDAGSVTRSWVVSSEGGGAEGSERSRSPAASSVNENEAGGSSSASVAGGEEGEAEQRMSESVVSVNTDTTRTSADSTSASALGTDGRSKAELWNEVKMLTLTRTLTTLYSTTLLCLLTTVQLTLLARLKYVCAVRAQEKEERRREKARRDMPSLAGMVLGGLVGGVFGGGGGVFGGGAEGGGAFEKMLSQLEAGGGFGGDDYDDYEEDEDEAEAADDDGWGFGWGPSSSSSAYSKSKSKSRSRSGHPRKDNVTGNRGVWTSEVSEDAESKYLTMSWWLLHVGWKDVGERVRRGVEEVFCGVSLKTKLTAGDLHRLIVDVRRRVECEITFEGTEKRTNFLSSLLPPTPETVHHVLLQGGFTPSYVQEGEGLTYRNRRQHIDVDVDVDLGLDLGQRDLRTGSGYETQPSRSQLGEQQQHQELRRHSHGHKANPSDAASTSVESSQLSYNFVDSPAMAVSSHPHRHHQQQNEGTTTYISAPPPPPPTLHLDTPFLSLLDETRSVLAGEDFGRVLEGCLDRAVEVLMEGMEGNVFARARTGGDVNVGEEEERVRLAGLLPGLARWSQLAMEGLPNELVDKILDMREVSCLSAVVFGRFEEQFAGV